MIPPYRFLSLSLFELFQLTLEEVVITVFKFGKVRVMPSKQFFIYMLDYADVESVVIDGNRLILPTVDEKGKTKNLTNIVKDFISKFVDPKAEVSFDRSMLLDYVESQMLSHANGYMWYANRGAWGDVNNVIIGMDMCLVFILESILTMFNAHKAIEETNYYKPIINLVRNSVKRVKVLCDEKIKILGVPGIAI